MCEKYDSFREKIKVPSDFVVVRTLVYVPCRTKHSVDHGFSHGSHRSKDDMSHHDSGVMVVGWIWEYSRVSIRPFGEQLLRIETLVALQSPELPSFPPSVGHMNFGFCESFEDDCAGAGSSYVTCFRRSSVQEVAPSRFAAVAEYVDSSSSP